MSTPLESQNVLLIRSDRVLRWFGLNVWLPVHAWLRPTVAINLTGNNGCHYNLTMTSFMLRMLVSVLFLFGWC